MATEHDVLEKKGPWLFLVPVSGIILTRFTNFEYKQDKISLISSSKVLRRRKKIGFPCRLSEFDKRTQIRLGEICSESSTVAYYRRTGVGKTTADNFLKTVREELSILALLQLGYSRRRLNAAIAISGEYHPPVLSYFMLNTKDLSWVKSNENKGKNRELILDEHWNNASEKLFFLKLLKIISGETKVHKEWRSTIRDASILAGQSQCSSDLPLSFLWNMIAIEMLLTRQGDKYSDSLPERVESFIGWASNWSIQNYEDRIKEVYRKRCEFVHNGNRDQIEIKDILFSDDILLNILINIVRHPDIFQSKDHLIKFSEKIKAEKLLGIKSKTIPKTLTYLKPNYSDDDYLKI